MNRFAGLGAITTGQWLVVNTPRGATAETPAILLMRGLTGSADQTGADELIPGLVRAGFTVITADLGGTATWANSDFDDAMLDVVDYILLDRGHEKLFIVAASMGGYEALHWMRHNEGIYEKAALLLPVANGQFTYAADGGIAASMDAAWSGNWSAVQPTMDPSTPMNMRAHQRSRVRLWYGTNDPIAGSSALVNWASAVGCKALPLGNVGHTLGSMTAAPIVEYFQAP